MIRRLVLMAVYNGIEFDGRVRRAAEAVAGVACVTVLSLATENAFNPSGYQVKTVRVPSPGRIKLWPHFVFWAAVVRESMRRRPRVVHAHDFFLAFPGWVAARSSGAQFVYDAHELIIPSPDTPMSKRDRFWYALESWAVRRANLVIAANHERAALMQSHYRLKRMPTVIRNIPPAIARGAALTHLAPPPPGVTRLIYQGDVSLDRGVGRFVEAVAQLGGAFELVIVGGGPDLGAVDELRHRLNAGDRIRLLGRVPASDLPALMASAHLGVVCYPTSGLNNVYCAPNKLYEYAQAGIPMVATPNRVVDAVFAAYGVGVSGEDVVSCIRAAVTSRELLIANIPRFLAENTWTDEASVLVDAYRCLLGDPAGKERAR